MAEIASLSDTEDVFWRALMRIVLSLPRHLDGDLLRTVGVRANEYLTLMSLSEAPRTELRMSDLADANCFVGQSHHPWTASDFLLVALDRPDVSLTGDLALRRTIQREYGFNHLPTDEELVELTDRWRPYRSLAVSYLFASEYGGPQ